MEISNPAPQKRIPIEEVVAGGFCVGCGACTIVDPSIDVVLNSFGEYNARLGVSTREQGELASSVCPFGSSVDEDALGDEVFPDIGRADYIGKQRGLYAGYSTTSRSSGASGGIITHLLCSLLDGGEIDYAVVITPEQDQSRRGLGFTFNVVTTKEEILGSGTSFYYPVSYSKVLKFIEENEGRYAITGVPCFHKALRLLRGQSAVLNERIKYQIGLVCGHMKSALYFEFLLRHSGIDGAVKSACFRRKSTGAPASTYFFEAIAKEGGKISSVNNRDIGVNWGMGLFKPKACDYCDDVFAECADIAVMDAWLPRFVDDSRGTSLIITRSEEVDTLLANDRKSGELHLENVEVEDIVASQLGGIRHRRHGLSFRLALSKGWVPTKRVPASFDYPIELKLEQLARIAMRKSSRLAMALQLSSRFRGLMVYYTFMFLPTVLYKLVSRAKSLASRYRNNPT